MGRATLKLVVRTPAAFLLDRDVYGVTAEEATGRFGVRPGCEPLLAIVVPGLLTVDTDPQELLLATGAGVLRAERDRVEVAVRHAVQCSSPADVPRELDAAQRQHQRGEQTMRRALGGLMQQLAVALARSERMP